MTAAAFDELARREVEVAVVEAGLGGRHDATGVLRAPIVVLTNVGLEHTRWLGPTIGDIAREKLAVVAPGATLVLGEADARGRGARGRDRRADRAAGRVDAPLPGFQRTNFAVACAAVREQLGVLDAAVVERVAARITVPGRMQVVAERPVDDPRRRAQPERRRGARRRPARAPVRRRRVDPRRQGRGARCCGRCCAAAPRSSAPRRPTPRALPPATLALARRAARRRRGDRPEPRAAVARAREIAGPDGAVVATGSIYLIADLVSARGAGGPPRCERRRPERPRHGRPGGRRGGPDDPGLLRPRLRFGQDVPLAAGRRGTVPVSSMHTLGVFGIDNDALNTAVNVLILVLIVVWAALVFWTFADARRRIDDPMLVGCATLASLFPFVGTIIYAIVRPPEYLDDVRLRELEMQAAEARLVQLDYELCPHCEYEVKARLPALPQLHAQAQGPLPLVRQGGRSRLAAVPLLRGGDGRPRRPRPTGRRRRRAGHDVRGRPCAEAPPRSSR